MKYMVNTMKLLAIYPPGFFVTWIVFWSELCVLANFIKVWIVFWNELCILANLNLSYPPFWEVDSFLE